MGLKDAPSSQLAPEKSQLFEGRGYITHDCGQVACVLYHERYQAGTGFRVAQAIESYYITKDCNE